MGEAALGFLRLKERAAEAERASAEPPLPQALRRWLDITAAAAGGGGDDGLCSAAAAAAAGGLGEPYLGSPLLARALCRPGDRMVLVDSHPDQLRLLRGVLGLGEGSQQNTTEPGRTEAAAPAPAGGGVYDYSKDDYDETEDNGGVAVETTVANGYQLVAANPWPYAGLRGLVFTDPPYTGDADTEQTVAMVRGLRSSWRSARVAVWYPISASGGREKAERLYRETARVARSGKREKCSLLVAELELQAGADTDADGADGADAGHGARLTGCGILLVEPPYGIDEELREVLPVLGRLLRDPGMPGELSVVVRYL